MKIITKETYLKAYSLYFLAMGHLDKAKELFQSFSELLSIRNLFQETRRPTFDEVLEGEGIVTEDDAKLRQVK
jgi:hypothetical protein